MLELRPDDGQPQAKRNISGDEQDKLDVYCLQDLLNNPFGNHNLSENEWNEYIKSNNQIK